MSGCKVGSARPALKKKISDILSDNIFGTLKKIIDLCIMILQRF